MEVQLDPEIASTAVTGWAAFSNLTRTIIVAAALATISAPVLWTVAFIRMKAEGPPGAPSPRSASNIDASGIGNTVTVVEAMEVHNHYGVGSTVPSTASLASGWARQLDINGRQTVEATTRDQMDFGRVEMKTVGVLNGDGNVTSLIRFINILEGGSWDINQTDILRSGDGHEIDLAKRFAEGLFNDRLEFSDAIICVGLASRQPRSELRHLMELTRSRADTLAQALKASAAVTSQKIYVLPLGGAKNAREIGSPDEPDERIALIVGVQNIDPDARLEDLIDDVLARASLTKTSLSDYQGARDARRLLQLPNLQ